MRFARFLTLSLLSAAIVAGCADASAGWTYLPAPSTTPRRVAPPKPAAPRATRTWSRSARSTSKFEQKTATAPADTPFQVQFENKDAGTLHNIALHLGDVNGAELFKGEIFAGIATRVYDVPALDAGAYAYVCTVHPTMTGTLTVE